MCSQAYLNELLGYIVDLNAELETELVELLVGVGSADGLEEMRSNQRDVRHDFETVKVNSSSQKNCFTKSGHL
jgi:hypothetical protein